MANELCSDDSCTSPRISLLFPDLDVVPIEQRPLQSSSSNSDFCFRNDTITLESPAADELFLNGKSIPIEIKNIINFSLKQNMKEQPQSPTPEPFLDAAITRNDSRYDQGSVVIEIKTSKENRYDQEFQRAFP